MFFQFNIISLALIFISFCSPILASSDSEEDNLTIVHPSPSTLNRVDNRHRIVAQYSDNLKLKDCSYTYNLNFPIDDELSREAYRYSQNDIGNSQFGKSHVLANGFDIYENDSELVFEYEHLTTRTFSEIGIGTKGTNIKIDWMSHQSQLPSEDYIFRRKLLRSHSEPQFIDDIDDLLMTKPDQLVKLFIPRSNKLKDSSVKIRMTGLELYGSFDMCDNCLSKLVTFRQKHQSGQQSISSAIVDKLKDKYTNVDANRFVIIYHTRFPYSEATYHTMYDQTNYKLRYLPECDNKFRYTTFRPKKYNEDYLEKDEDLDGTVLYQAREVEVEKDIIYGQIHSLYGDDTVAQYQKPFFNNNYKFIFN